MRLVVLAAASLLAVAPALAQTPTAPAVSSTKASPPGPGDWRAIDAANTVVIDTSQGRILVELYPQVAPDTVTRIETLVRQHFYDGLTFFRVIDGFMDQTGDPLNTGTGGSTLPNLKGEFAFRFTPGTVATEVAPIPGGEIGFVGTMPVASQPSAMAPLTVDGKVRGFGVFCSGVIGMARAQTEDSANSQFFLMRGEQLSLDQKYTAFGRVISGEAAVRAIKTGDPVVDPRDRIVTMQMLADMPAASRPNPRVLDTSSAYFKDEAARLRVAKGNAFDPCAIDVPTAG